jgi:hypothetical protein
MTRFSMFRIHTGSHRFSCCYSCCIVCTDRWCIRYNRCSCWRRLRLCNTI